MLSQKEILKRDLKIIKKSNSWIKGFDDLKFIRYSLSVTAEAIKNTTLFEDYKGAKKAGFKIKENGFVSILLGKCFYSNGVDTYEFYSHKTADPICYIEKDIVEMYMFRSQLENPKILLIEKKDYYFILDYSFDSNQ